MFLLPLLGNARLVDLRLPLATYAEFCQHLTQATGASFVASPAIAGRKLTVVCHARPVPEVMRAVVDALHVAWVPGSAGTSMVLSTDERAAEAAQAKADVSADRQALEAFCDGASTVASTGWREQAALVARSPRLKELSRWATLARRLALLQSRIEDLLRGEVVLVSSGREPGAVWSGAPSVSGGFVETKERCFFRYRSATRRLEFCSRSPARGRPWQSLDIASQEAAPQGPLALEESATASPIDRPLDGFRAPLPEGLSRCTTLGSHLAALSDATGFAVVAPASRFAVARDALARSATVEDYLRTLRKASDRPGLAPLGGWCVRDGWLVARPRAWWRLAGREPSEGWIRPLERAYADPKASMMDAETDAASSLRPVDEAALDEGSTLVVDAPLQSLRVSREQLRLWAWLSPAARRQALSEGLPVTSEPPYVRAIEASMPVSLGASPSSFPFDSVTVAGPLRLCVVHSELGGYTRGAWDLEIEGGVTEDDRNMDHVVTNYASPNARYAETDYRFDFVGGGKTPKSWAVTVRHRLP